MARQSSLTMLLTENNPMIAQTTDGRLFMVADYDDANLAHVWRGVEVKRVKGGYTVKSGAKETMVRKAGSKIVA